MNLSKVREADHSYYVLNTGSISKWEKRLENYMEDGLVMLRPVQHQVVLKTLQALPNRLELFCPMLSILSKSLPPYVVMMSATYL